MNSKGKRAARVGFFLMGIVVFCILTTSLSAANPAPPLGPIRPAPTIPVTQVPQPTRPLLSYYLYDAAFVSQYPNDPVEAVLTACTFQKLVEFVQLQQRQIQVLEKRLAALEAKLNPPADPNTAKPKPK